MKPSFRFFALAAFLLTGLGLRAGNAATTAPALVDYASEVQPIFDQYCVACHACFDAPCQLNLGSAEGLLRGASKHRVYDGGRMEPASPTRLYIDAATTAEWRQQAFFPVHVRVENHPSVLEQLLKLKNAVEQPANKPLSPDLDLSMSRENECPAAEDIGAYRESNPHAGMPFALPELPSEARDTLARWLQQGAPVSSAPAETAAADASALKKWERFLNQPDHGHRLLARWLYEHWSVARLHIKGTGSDQFYRLVRSRTPSGLPVSEIASRHPNDDAGEPFHYRFRAVPGTRVYKTHIPFELSDALLSDVERSFAPARNAPQTLPGYSEAERANPFLTFAALPAEARYRFMLNNAEYFIRTFIRGPVCRGQLATDVIRDHFWVLFQDPDHDPYITSGEFRTKVDPLLTLPGLESDLMDGAKSWFAAEDDRNHYLALRQTALDIIEPQGPGLESLWQENGNALLTVFRHHDSATVKRGWVGQIPRTTWWMDFPLLERSYYNLVVNFDVFGTMPHQLQTRLYFDLIRNGAEQNFLRLLPGEARQALIKDWYQGSGELKRWLSYEALDVTHPTAIAYQTAAPYQELLEGLLHRETDINASADDLNRCTVTECGPTELLLQRLSTSTAADMPAVLQFPETTLLMVRSATGTSRLYTLIRNRDHSNVAFILGESLRYQPHNDTLTVVPGIATGYPNFILQVDETELAALVGTLRAPELDSEANFVKQVVDRWGVRRTNPGFWQIFGEINAIIKQQEPLTAGLLDLNRYIDYR